MGELNNTSGSFEESMQDMFSGMEASADAHVWQNIELALQPTTDRALAWWWWSGAASIILIFMIGSSIFDVGHTYDPRMVMNDQFESVYLEDCGDVDDSESRGIKEHSNYTMDSSSDISDFNSDKTLANHSGKIEKNNSVQGEKNQSNEVVYRINPHVNAVNEGESIQILKKAQLVSNWDTARLVYREEESIKIYDDSDIDWQDWDDSKASEWGLAANLGSSNSRQQAEGSFGFQSDGLTAQENTVAMGFGDQRSVQELTYLSPFVIGLRGNWKFTKRLSLESGLSYSMLPTNGESYSGGLKRVNRYVDHFLGLPILLNLSIIDKKRFGLYSSQGVLVEKGIASRSTLTTYLGSEEQAKQISKLKAQGIQLGASFGVGAEYRINKTWGLFVEPRITSWLLNLNVQENIRNQQVIWPTLDIGVRLNLQ